MGYYYRLTHTTGTGQSGVRLRACRSHLQPPRPIRALPALTAATPNWEVSGCTGHVRPWAARLSQEAMGRHSPRSRCRWGSVRPATAAKVSTSRKLLSNCHPSLIDYVPVNEVARFQKQITPTPSDPQSPASCPHTTKAVSIPTVGKRRLVGLSIPPMMPAARRLTWLD